MFFESGISFIANKRDLFIIEARLSKNLKRVDFYNQLNKIISIRRSLSCGRFLFLYQYVFPNYIDKIYYKIYQKLGF